MLDLKAKNSCRVHMGVPVQGYMQSGMAMGWRYHTPVAMLEYRMNNLNPQEETELTGNSIGAVRIMGVPQVGDTVTVQVNALTPMTYTVTSANIAVASNPEMSVYYSIALGMQQQWNLLNYPYIASAGPAIFRQSIAALPNFGEFILTNMASASFKITTSSTGHTSSFVASPGSPPAFQFPFINTDGVTTTQIYGLLPILDYLKMQVLQAMDNFAFSEAGLVKFRPDEAQQRQGLYENYRAVLSQIMGVRLDPLGNPNDGASWTL